MLDDSTVSLIRSEILDVMESLLSLLSTLACVRKMLGFRELIGIEAGMEKDLSDGSEVLR